MQTEVGGRPPRDLNTPIIAKRLACPQQPNVYLEPKWLRYQEKIQEFRWNFLLLSRPQREMKEEKGKRWRGRKGRRERERDGAEHQRPG